ncbi:alpha/beta hydrolase [Pseudomonas purpurea]|uniref:alpha/beta hydrolase n=1 Tax=Pseudomonas purpurea TaxID=3136737 RepID=UPI0032657557
MGGQAALDQPCTGRLLGSHGLTCTEDTTPKPVTMEREVVVFFIGGAGDKESYYGDGPSGHTYEAQRALERKVAGKHKGKFKAVYLGYNEVKGDSDIENYVYSEIDHKSVHVYIVGHSLGGWNGAHLSSLLSDKGYLVKMLVTLDPVGEGFFVALISDIYWSEPEPKAEYWINVLADPINRDRTDTVAWLGEKWIVESGPNIKGVVRVNHWAAEPLYNTYLEGGKSACDISYESIISYLGIKE